MKNPVKMKDGKELFWLEDRNGQSHGYIEVHDGTNNKGDPFIIIANVNSCVSLSGRDVLQKLATEILKVTK